MRSNTSATLQNTVILFCGGMVGFTWTYYGLDVGVLVDVDVVSVPTVGVLPEVTIIVSTGAGVGFLAKCN